MRATVGQLDQMIRILGLRVKHTTQAYQQQLAVVAEQQQNVLELRREVAQLDADSQNVLRFLESLDSRPDSIKLADANTRRRWLAYDREKSEYYLDIALEDLAEAETELAVKKQLWLKAQARETQTCDQRRMAVRETELDREFRESIDIQEQICGSALIGASRTGG